jgi:hypothetical protein
MISLKNNNNNGFIGMGANPEPGVPDIPLGLGMALFQDAQARGNFENLSAAQKTGVIKYIQTGNVTGNDAKMKIRNAVKNLRSNNIDFV